MRERAGKRLSQQPHSQQSIAAIRAWLETDRAWIWLSAMVALVFFLTTLQWQINGLTHPYTTDVGEIQNALPRWGTLHFTGYPQYTFLGSLFVTVLRLLGVSPAAGASLFSALWGVLSVGLLTALIMALGVRGPVSAVASLLFALSTSMWIDASLAELHTMTMALTFAALLAAVHFGRRGRTRDLYWLAFLASQGVTHQRAFAFLAPALLVLVWRQWPLIWRKLPQVILLGLTGPLTYLYLPLVDWLGSEWVFSSPGTWEGFWALLLDTKAERIVSIPSGLAGWGERVDVIVGLLSDDWPGWLWLSGLFALTFFSRRLPWRERLGLALLWIPYLLVSLIIWEGNVSDALLAVKLPVIAAAATGLALLGQLLWRQGQRWPYLVLLLGGVAVIGLAMQKWPEVVAVTRGGGVPEAIVAVERVPPPADGQPVTMMALWGDDFWQLAYAQRYEGKFPHLNLVDHNADFASIVARGDHLYTLSRTLYARSQEWWERQLGTLHLTEVAPGVVSLSPAAQKLVSEASGGEVPFTLGNGVVIREARVHPTGPEQLLVEIVWQAEQRIEHDFSVAVHLVSQDPPAGPQDVVAQADSAHPVDGWYPVSRWTPGEVVRDFYLLPVPESANPVAVRIAMYRMTADGSFENTRWLSQALESESR